MVSPRSTPSTRKTGGANRGPATTGSSVSRARWAGVTFVILAIATAVLLAVASPSGRRPTTEAGAALVDPAADPTAVAVDGPVPSAKPRIIEPADETVTGEFEIPMTVDVPAEEIPRKKLTLRILRGDEILGSTVGPKDGGAVTVDAVHLDAGRNVLTAVLVGPNDAEGPRSEPVTIIVDDQAPSLAITAPDNRYETYDDVIVVNGTSEVGSRVTLAIQANEWDASQTVDASGVFSFIVPLTVGKNKIQATATSSVGTAGKPVAIVVSRKDGTPTIKVKPVPKSMKVRRLPQVLTVKVTVTDASGDPMPGAEVSYTLGGSNRSALDDVAETDEAGRSHWTVRVAPSSSPSDALQLTVTVTTPRGEQGQKAMKIPLD
jgi:hypothetical protein